MRFLEKEIEWYCTGMRNSNIDQETIDRNRAVVRDFANMLKTYISQGYTKSEDLFEDKSNER